MDNYEILDINLLKSLVVNLMNRRGIKEVHLPERKLTDEFELVCRHDTFGAKFKFFIVEKEK
jgi:hypothetical protein